jgi:uncharacterized 2Fe-2S/4Fe-4S cluster protein (DUF4445 family)
MSVISEDFLVNNEFQKKGETGKHFGISFDVGTTTVVGMLWDLATGVQLAVHAEENPQAAYGADVISRIMFAGDSENNLLLLQREIIGCLNHIINVLADDGQISKDNLREVTIVGNTTMSHLVVGADPSSLARSPFTPVFCSEISKKAKEFGLEINADTNITVLPNIAGHVGSDITAGLIASGIMKKPGVHLMIDIGTNGEIVLCADGKALACSTAAGPAFEGASIFHGIRAREGAIERVYIDKNDVSVQTIGDVTAIGICGSGIIDAASEMVKAELIDKTGRLITVQKALEKGIADRIVTRLTEGETGREFVLAYAGARRDCTGCDGKVKNDGASDIVITQKDIREVQLAKGAISAGIKLMLKELGLGENDINYIYIAGAFGNHVRPESAVKIGLIPNIEKEKIIYIGNAAGIGASMVLLSVDAREEARQVATSIRHIELADDPLFQDTYVKAMGF